MQNFHWFALFVGLNGALLLVLAFNVSLMRLKNKISLGDGDNPQLMKAIRVHANGTEQVPMFGLIILALTFMLASQTILSILVLTFTFSRLAHAYGMLFKVHILRRAGAGITYLLQAVGVVILLISIFNVV